MSPMLGMFRVLTGQEPSASQYIQGQRLEQAKHGTPMYLDERPLPRGSSVPSNKLEYEYVRHHHRSGKQANRESQRFGVSALAILATGIGVGLFLPSAVPIVKLTLITAGGAGLAAASSLGREIFHERKQRNFTHAHGVEQQEVLDDFAKSRNWVVIPSP